MDATGDTPHWGLSRALYRAAIACAAATELDDRERVRILDATDHAASRLVENPGAARCARRWLYGEIRGAYALEDLPVLCASLSRAIEVAGPLVELIRSERVRPCAALTRAGVACQRQAHGESEYCPSHSHLEWREEPVAVAS